MERTPAQHHLLDRTEEQVPQTPYFLMKILLFIYSDLCNFDSVV